MREASPQVRQSKADSCYHCGLPVPAGIRYGVLAGADWRAVCCAGCAAVAQAILGQGLDDFYRLREQAPLAPPPDAEEDLTLYDHAEAQRGFVRRCGDALEATLLLEGVRCAACAWLNEQVIGRLDGVGAVEVNYATRRVHLRWDPQRLRLSEVLAAIRSIGYRAWPCDPARADALARDERRAALWRLFVAGFGMMQIMMYAFPAYLAGEGDMSADIGQLMRWASLVLTLPVVAYSAAPFFAGAWRDLRSRRLGMDVPIALGIGIAFVASAAATLTGTGEVYFDTVVMFVFLLLFGRYLELVARQRATRSLDHLARLVPEFANRLRDFPNSLETERVPVAALLPPQRVLVKPGETFPADGVVEQGEGSVGEALLSGEARPVMKRAGSEVIGGAINLSNPLVVRIVNVGADTVMASVLRMVERAAAHKPRLIRIADRAASLFVLMVLALALAAGVFWSQADPARALMVVVAVLVATCPCALSLATPVALTVAHAGLAARGIVLARADAFEALANVTDAVFDKTGTLTHGQLRLTAIVPCAALPAQRCLAIAAAIESASEHPVGAAIAAAAAGAPRLKVGNLSNCPGSGVEAEVEARRYRLGKLEYAGELSGRSAAATGAEDDAVWLGDAGGLLAAFRFDDELRAEAPAVMRSLARMGVTLHLLSGDEEQATGAAARALGIRNVESRATPARKRDYVAALQRAGRTVAMIGDGINDAPVLAQADVSLAPGDGARLAQLRADAVILSRSLRDLPPAIAAARRTLKVIRQNIAWAFAYNLSVLPLALAGMLTPWAAAIGMSGSSLIVVLNALRLLGDEAEFLEPSARPVAAASAA